MKDFNKLCENYAKLAVTRGVGLQKGQTLVINAQVGTADFVALVAEAAFKEGACDVVVHYDHPELNRLRLLNAGDEVLTNIPEWQTQAELFYMDKEACFLRVVSIDPDLMADVSPEKSAMWKKAVKTPLQPLSQKRMENDLSWSCVCVPNKAWAKKVFPNKPEAEAVDALWEAIFSCCYVTADSAEGGWDKHIEEMLVMVKKINSLDLKTLRFKNGKGTDIVMDICDGGVFAGGICHCPEPDGYLFAPNIPTEEILTTPHRFSANGIVYNTLPLNYGGSIIDDFSLTLKDGVVTDFTCNVGYDVLKGILETDEGSRRFGEIALVPITSPINKSGILFYDTLYDENASCHIALGAGYTDVIMGDDRSEEALVSQGLNVSVLHVDFMFGSDDMSCIGVTKAGETVEIFKNGMFAI